jgi:hypothetical protein
MPSPVGTEEINPGKLLAMGINSEDSGIFGVAAPLFVPAPTFSLDFYKQPSENIRGKGVLCDRSSNVLGH